MGEKVEKAKLEQARKIREEAIQKDKEEKKRIEEEERIKEEKKNREELEEQLRKNEREIFFSEVKVKERDQAVDIPSPQEIGAIPSSAPKYVPPAKRFGVHSSGSRWGDSSSGNSFGGIRGGGFGGGKYESSNRGFVSGGRHLSGGDYYGKRDSERGGYGSKDGDRHLKEVVREIPQDKFSNDSGSRELR